MLNSHSTYIALWYHCPSYLAQVPPYTHFLNIESNLIAHKRMFASHLVVLCTLPLLALGATVQAIPVNFDLYGYGPGLGGLPLFYADGRQIFS